MVQSSCTPGNGSVVVGCSSTTPLRCRALGFTTSAATPSAASNAARAVRRAPRRARSTRPSPIACASANRSRTARTTSSWEQAQIESWAEFWTMSFQASSR